MRLAAVSEVVGMLLYTRCTLQKTAADQTGNRLAPPTRSALPLLLLLLLTVDRTVQLPFENTTLDRPSAVPLIMEPVNYWWG